MIDATNKVKNTRVCQIEILSSVNKVRLVSSKGMNHTVKTSDIYLEATFISKNKGFDIRSRLLRPPGRQGNSDLP